MLIKLPISKSIANRLLLLQAIHGDELMPVTADMPDDVLVLHDALEQLREFSRKSKAERQKNPLTLYLKNCGTALRFLQVHLEKCYQGEPITLTGDPRLMERVGAPTTQTTSALILHGVDVPWEDPENGYILLSRILTMQYDRKEPIEMEFDWSSTAFWYEYVAIHRNTSIVFDQLRIGSLQSDSIVSVLYSMYFGVETELLYEENSLQISAVNDWKKQPVKWNFEECPDLYPAVALTCERLGVPLEATGTERLRYKESDRLEAVRLHEVRNDHRMAMALMAADFPVSEEEQACIAKSYPQFVEQFRQITSEP